MNIIKANAVLDKETIEVFNELPHEKIICHHGTVFLYANDHITVAFLAIGLYGSITDRLWYQDDHLKNDGKTSPEEAIKIILNTKWNPPCDKGVRRANFAKGVARHTYNTNIAKSATVSTPIVFGEQLCTLFATGEYGSVNKFIAIARGLCDPETMVCNAPEKFYTHVRRWELELKINLTSEEFRDSTMDRDYDLKAMIGSRLPIGCAVQLYSEELLGKAKFKETADGMLSVATSRKHPYMSYLLGDDYLLIVGSNSLADSNTASDLISTYNIPRTYRELARIIYKSAINDTKA